MTDTSMEDILASIRKMIIEDELQDNINTEARPNCKDKDNSNNINDDNINKSFEEKTYANKIFKLTKSQIIDLDDNFISSEERDKEDEDLNKEGTEFVDKVVDKTVDEFVYNPVDKYSPDILETRLINKFFNKEETFTERETVKNIINIDKVANNFISSRNMTLEDVVTAAIRPVIGDWLNNHLQSVVEDVVKKEMQKIIDKK